MDQKNKIGIYLCSGCSIGDSIDLESVRSVCSKDEDVVFCGTEPFLCESDVHHEIADTISREGLKKLVIGACSPRIKKESFSFGTIPVERVNLREQVAWSHPPGDGETQLLAEDLIRMGVTRARTVEIPEIIINPDLTTDILVVGGGISGITAALESARAGYAVFLIEKENQLGGKAALLHKQVPVQAPFNQLTKPVVHQKIYEVEEEQKIEIHLSSTIEQISGQPGDFVIRILTKGEKKVIKAAAIIMATGWEPYEAKQLKEFGYDQYQDVLTNLEFEKMVNGSTILRPSDKKPARKILFVQCAGSRDPDHLPYCSNYCCGTTLKQATYIRQANPDARIFIIYKDIRTPGVIENFYKEVQKDRNIFMTKGVVSGISSSDTRLIVTVEESLIDDRFQLEADLVVLATGMVPNDTTDLNLDYRLGKGIPTLKYEFPDSHFICFPFETRRTGIYTAGNLRNPGYIQASMEDATGAALKAIQCIELTRQGKAVHPRSGDQSIPELYMPRCTECKRCTEECPFGSYDETEKGTPILNPNRCRRCAICMGSCPERIINFPDYSVDSISSMIKSVEVDGESVSKIRILAFVCENDAYPAFDMAGMQHLLYPANLRIIPVRCIGSVNRVWISDALSQGFDGILIIGCKPGDDYQCHFIQGSELTETRSKNIQETLETMRLEKERVRTEFMEINEYFRIPELVESYIQEIEKIGLNPFRGI